MNLTLAIRNIRKRPFLNLIKITGLLLSLSTLVLITLFLKEELSYDNYHSRSDRIYRFTTTSPTSFSGKHFARLYKPDYIPEMVRSFPGIENYVRLSSIAGGIVEWKENRILISQAFECDSTFFQVFDATLVAGNPDQVFNSPSSMVVTESFARRTFNGIDPIGQVVKVPTGQYYGESIEYEVKGIMKDFPANSHFHPELITTPADPNALNDWAWVYLLFQENASPNDVINAFSEFYISYFELDPEDYNLTAHLQGIRDIHLKSKKTREIESNGSILVVYSFSAAAVILLFIALINYFNLNLGMAVYTDKFLFVSRIFGATRRIQLKYFVTEGLIITLIAHFFGIVFVVIANSFIRGRLGLDLLEGNFLLIVGLTLIVFLMGFLTGFLPMGSIYLTTLVSSARNISGGIFNRRGINRSLIVFQYTITLILIVAVAVIHRQTNYAINSSIGSKNRDIICISNLHSDVQQKFTGFKEELLKYPSIQYVSAMFEHPGGDLNDMFRFYLEGYEADETKYADSYIGILPCDYSFTALFDLNILAGRHFSTKFSDNEGTGEYIINESALKRVNYTNPQEIIGKEFQLFFHSDAIQIPKGSIVGVLEDFHISSLKREIEPLVLFKRSDLWIENFLISFNAGMTTEALNSIEMVWNDMFPQYTFRYEFIDAMYRDVYRSEKLQSTLLFVFTIIALFMSSMGLLGMSLLTTERRIKEIGIRVVNGADLRSIMVMLNWDFLKWIFVSFFASIPLAYISIQRWLEEYVYRTEVEWWIFGIAALLLVLISGATISLQSWKAARKNPVEILRYE